MTDARRQRLLLATFFVLLVIAGLRYLLPWLRSAVGVETAALSSPVASRPARDKGGNAPAMEVLEIRVGDLAAEPRDYRPGRDPWRFGAPPPPPPPPGPTPEELAARRAQEEAARRQAQQPVEPAGPQPPAIQLVYLGSFGPSGRRIAVFSDGKNIYNARVGDVLEGKFVVHNIGYESVDLKFVDFPDVPPRRLAVGG